jgi:O-antigen/teichoic acid export membrane protein
MKILKVKLQRFELFANLALGACFRLLGAFSVFLMSLMIGRTLGADESGYFFLAFGIITFLSAFSRLGFDNSLVRFVGAGLSDKSWGDIRFVVTKSIILVSFVSSLVALLLFVSSEQIATVFFNKPLLAPVLKSLAPGVVGLSLFTLFAMALQGLHKVAPSVFILNISVNLWVILATYLGMVSSSAETGLVWSIASLITMLLGCIFWFLYLKPVESPPSVNWSILLASAIPLWVVLLKYSKDLGWF